MSREENPRVWRVVPILLSGCGSNTSATSISDYDKVSLIEYQECLALFGTGEITIFTNDFSGTQDQSVSSGSFQYVLEECKKYRPVKEEIPLPVK